MSTYLYLECLDHDPVLQSEDEVGQHLSDLPRIRAEIANRPTEVPERADFGAADEADNYFARNAARFLVEHPKCRIGIRDEYGHEHPTSEESDHV